MLTKYMFAQNQPGLGPGDDQGGEDMAGCPNNPEPPRGAPDQLKGTPDPQEGSFDILRSPPGGGRSANPHCRRICPVFSFSKAGPLRSWQCWWYLESN